MILPDLNMWLAAVWKNHSHHQKAKQWFDGEEDSIVFCRVTQMGFLRLISNKSVMRSDVLTRLDAWNSYEQLVWDERIQYIAEPDGMEMFWKMFSKKPDHSHLLWTDDYLAAFALKIEARIVTFDRAMKDHYPSVDISIVS